LKTAALISSSLQSLIPREAVFAIADEAKKQGIAFEGTCPIPFAHQKCPTPAWRASSTHWHFQREFFAEDEISKRNKPRRVSLDF